MPILVFHLSNRYPQIPAMGLAHSVRSFSPVRLELHQARLCSPSLCVSSQSSQLPTPAMGVLKGGTLRLSSSNLLRMMQTEGMAGVLVCLRP
jgi:hypothetical protein